MRIALASKRQPKIDAVQEAARRVRSLGIPGWERIELLTLSVATIAPEMPLTDEELMDGARLRVIELIRLLYREPVKPDLYVGLEGGLHRTMYNGTELYFLRGWAFVSDGLDGYFGSSPSIFLPEAISSAVVGGKEELGTVIDRASGMSDVRSRQGTWGVLTKNMIVRSDSFVLALLAALAPFYNAQVYRVADC